MQSKDKASLNVKCYKKTLPHNSVAKRWQFLLYFQSLNSKEKRICTHFPNHLLGQKWWHIPSTPSNTTMSLRQTMLDHIKTVSWHSPSHAGGIPSPILGIIPEIYYSTHHETQYLFLLAIVHGTWDHSRTGIKPATPALDAQSLNCWTTKGGSVLWQRCLWQLFLIHPLLAGFRNFLA